MRKLPASFASFLNFVGQIATGMLVLGVAINFINVIGRYFFHHSLEWAEEVMIYLMVGSVFFAGGAISMRGAHISMDMLLAAMPDRTKWAVTLLNDLIQIAVGVLIIWLATPVVMQLFEFDQRSEALQIPIYIPQAAVPIGLALMVVGVALRRFLKPR